jgi:hypothetical protein
MKNWKETVTNTVEMLKYLFYSDIFHCMKKPSPGNEKYWQWNLHNKIDQ